MQTMQTTTEAGLQVLYVKDETVTTLYAFADGVEHMRGNELARVEVWHPREAFGEPSPAELNWPSSSSSASVETARAAAALLSLAADYANDL